MSSLRQLGTALKYALKEEGVQTAAKKIGKVIKDNCHQLGESLKKGADRDSSMKQSSEFYDIMFINGCDYSLPHPIRYRVDHQMEQLEAAGYACLKVDGPDLTMNHVRQARLFIVYRFPYTDLIGEFIRTAKTLNKRVLYDIDDLIIDTKYTDPIPFIQAMHRDDRKLYDDGVIRMGKTLKLCDGAITTTETLAKELEHYVPHVYINRNTASEGLLKISQEAVFRRDVLPRLPDTVHPAHLKKVKKKWTEIAESDDIVIGYFSGSITHNDDFQMILPALKRIMEEDSRIKLMIMGELDLPEELKDLGEGRIIVHPFGSWTKLPFYIAQCDINIAPLEDSIFNRAKSENKWVEASLVKVPTIASDVGAFHTMIDNGTTGVLCSKPEDWYDALKTLSCNKELRKTLGERSYEYCYSNCTTIRTSPHIKRIIESCITPNIAFILPSLQISGGVLVALKHGCFLQEAGYDVSYLGIKDPEKWVECDGHRFPVLNRIIHTPKFDNCPFRGWFDKLVATFWATLDFALRYPKAKEIMYLVQGYEVDFYEPDDQLRIGASSTYQQVPDVRYITISKWCKSWLEEIYDVTPRFIPNGIDTDYFTPSCRDWANSKIRILIEGNCESLLKNIDEAFEITNGLNPEKYEIWYMSYTGKSKAWYRIDNNLGFVPRDKVADVYRQCHILLKSSIHESFSYPPLEMMATGGIVIVRPNEGNKEYLEDGYNCLFYSPYETTEARRLIDKLAHDEALRDMLSKNGLLTAHNRNWDSIKSKIVDAYL